MLPFARVTWRAAVVGRWTARILGTLLVLVFLAFYFGEGPPVLSRLTSTERLSFLGVAGILAGLLASWKWEGLGGLLTLAGFGGLIAIDRHYLVVWGFTTPAAIGLLHVLCWSRLCQGPPGGHGRS